MQSFIFKGIKAKTKRIKKVLCNYELTDVVAAVFCITIFLQNRSCVEQLLALNSALIECDEYGERKIQTYDEFKEFFNNIRGLIKAPAYIDDISQDFGQARMEFFKEYSPVILGTGHNGVFAYLHFLAPVAECLGREAELRQILEYHTCIIDYFQETNKVEAEYTGQLPALPPEILFYKTREFFESEINNWDLERLNSIFNNNYIEHCHFYTSGEKVLPLYNPSMLVDLCNEWIRDAGRDNHNVIVNKAIASLLNSIYLHDSEKSPGYIAPASICSRDETIWSEEALCFCLMSYDCLILAINGTGFEEKELTCIADRIEVAHKKGTLIIKEMVPMHYEKTLLAIKPESSAEIHVLVFKDILDIDVSAISGDSYTSAKNYSECTANDLIYYICFAENAAELCRYLSYKKTLCGKSIISFGGDATLFLSWKEQGETFERGAVEYGSIMLDPQIDSTYVVEYYENLVDYPWMINNLLVSPFAWRFIKNAMMTECRLRAYPFIFGNIKAFQELPSFIISLTNAEFYRDSTDPAKELGLFDVVEDLNIRMIYDCSQCFESAEEMAFSGIELIYQPWMLAENLGYVKYETAKNKNYVVSDLYYDENIVTIRYSVKEELFDKIETANDRSVETQFFKELLAPLKKIMPALCSSLSEKLDTISDEKKTIETRWIELDYHYDEYIHGLKIPDTAYMQARKKIAEICVAERIEPGTYRGEEANRVIRAIQNKMIEAFEDEVRRYNIYDLHTRMLEIYARLLHSNYIERKRYDYLDGFSENDRRKIEEEIINSRKEMQHQLNDVLYLLETNIYLVRDEGENVNKDRIDMLLAFAHWCYLLQEDADICHFTPELVYIIINSDYVVDAEAEERIGYLEYCKRTYDVDDYVVNAVDTDRAYFEKTLSALNKDLGVDFRLVIELLRYLQIEAVPDSEKICPNVYLIERQKLTEGFIRITNSSVSCEAADKAIQFLIADVETLKTRGNNGDKYLRIGDRKGRNNRFEIKPLTEFEKYIIYSPVQASYVAKRWVDGLLQWYPPYEKGLTRTMKILDEWKRVYEKKMVYDLADEFRNAHFGPVKENYSVDRPDKDGDYPNDIGDYDVIAIDQNRKVIWIVECKVIKKVGSFFEMHEQQRSFFEHGEYDRKFDVRIDYMTNHYRKILQLLDVPPEEYSIIPLMCTNKVFTAIFKKVDFEIISYSELVQRINNTTQNNREFFQ